MPVNVFIVPEEGTVSLYQKTAAYFACPDRFRIQPTLPGFARKLVPGQLVNFMVAHLRGQEDNKSQNGKQKTQSNPSLSSSSDDETQSSGSESDTSSMVKRVRRKKSAKIIAGEKEYSLFVKDTSLCSLGPTALARALEELQDTGDKWDLCYLARWQDKCNLYRDPQQLKQSTSYLIRTHYPIADQAILISPRGRRKLLGEEPLVENKQKLNLVHYKQITEEIYAGNLVAQVVTPSWFSFNEMFARKNEDYQKTHVCAPIPQLKPPDTSRLDIARTVLIILALVIIVLLLYCIAY